MRPLLPIALLSLSTACAPWTPPAGPSATPTPGPTPTPVVAGLWNPPVSDDLLRNPDHGWVASNPSRTWDAAAGQISNGDPYRVASVIDMTASLADWMAPADGSDPADAADGSAAARVQEAIDRGRYVALGVYADDVADLPPGWPTTDVPFDPADPSSILADGLISTVDLGDRIAPNYADPDYRTMLGGVVVALGDRFGTGPGVAFVHVSGIGDGGTFTFEDSGPWFDDPGAPFVPATWVAMTTFLFSAWEDSFPDSTAFLSWQSIDHAFEETAWLEMLASDDFELRDGCVGGCGEPEFDRFPGGSGTPFPSDDPYGGWLPGDLADTKQLLTSSGLGGIADWRIAEDEGTWDTATYGSVDDYMDTVFGAAIEHSSLRFATLSDSACRSEWVIGATPEGSVCSGQVAGDVWEPLLEYGRRMGTRYAVTEVRAATPEVTGSQWSIEVDMVNLADGRDFSDRQIEFGFLDRSNREPLDTLVLTPDPPLTQWTPGQTVTLLVDVPTAGLNAEDPAAYSLYVRILDERAFGGGIELAHDDRDDSGQHALVTWQGE